MSLSIKLKNLFSHKKSTDTLGIALRPQSLAFCHVSENSAPFYETIHANSAKYSQAFPPLKDKYELTGQCHLVLAASMYQIVQVEKPKVPDEEVNSALKWQIKDLVNFAPENMIVDYFDAPTIMGSSEKINVVCASLTELKSIVEQLSDDDFSIKSITTEEFAFASLVPIVDDASLLVCQQPGEEIVLIIVKEGKIYFHRRLRGFTQIAMRSEEELSMSVIDSLSLELQRSTDYFERQLKQAPIKNIKIILPMDTESFVARKLAENTNIPVNLLELPQVSSLETSQMATQLAPEVEAKVSGLNEKNNENISITDQIETVSENEIIIDRAFAAVIGATMLNNMEQT